MQWLIESRLFMPTGAPGGGRPGDGKKDEEEHKRVKVESESGDGPRTELGRATATNQVYANEPAAPIVASNAKRTQANVFLQRLNDLTHATEVRGELTEETAILYLHARLRILEDLGGTTEELNELRRTIEECRSASVRATETNELTRSLNVARSEKIRRGEWSNQLQLSYLETTLRTLENSGLASNEQLTNLRARIEEQRPKAEASVRAAETNELIHRLNVARSEKKRHGEWSSYLQLSYLETKLRIMEDSGLVRSERLTNLRAQIAEQREKIRLKDFRSKTRDAEGTD